MDSFIKDPTLKTVLSPYWSYIGLPPNKMNFHDMAAMIYGYCEFKPFHLKGGSQALSNAIADTIIRNGGTIHYNCAAKKIIVKDGKVQGVLTENEDEITAKYVISNASKISTYVDMMDEEHVPDAIRGELRQTSIAQGGFIIYMGLDCEPEEAGFTESTNFIFGNTDANKAYERMKVADINQDDFLLLSCYDLIDPSFSPEGTCQAALITLKYGDAWLRIPPAQYAAKKHECADAMLKVAGKLYPNLRNHIEEIEIATPITSMRYLGHPNGSFYGFEHHIKDSETFLPNESHIKGLYGAGGWVGLCGFQTTLDSGARIGRTIYKEINA
ncbi:FAD-dependent oxidoreductase [bacterium]|nr:FAD-dependent oxidoreductase [bacterium]